MLLDHLTKGTENTRTGQHIGMEIETDFLDFITGRPITAEVKGAILEAAVNPPVGCVVQHELGRQKIELAIDPYENAEKLLDIAQASLDWLYGIAAQHGARPLLGPEVSSDEALLTTDELRDQLFVAIDGRPALEELCRNSSVQFTVDVNPRDAVAILNELWAARLHELDYEPNNRRWQRYMALSKAGFDPLRYGGPQHFDSLEDYARKLARLPVIMHQGRAVRLDPETTPDLDADLFLRSVWWHYRLRRYGDTLTVEIRPFARRGDEAMAWYWSKIAPIFGRRLETAGAYRPAETGTGALQRLAR